MLKIMKFSWEVFGVVCRSESVAYCSLGVLQRCAAYFTTILYVEHWCKDKFGSLTLGEPDFSMDNKVLLQTSNEIKSFLL